MPKVNKLAWEVLRDEILSNMGVEHSRVTSNQGENNLVEGQSAAVWVTNNLNKRIAICKVPNGYVWVDHTDPHRLGSVKIQAASPPMRNAHLAAMFVLDWLFPPV